MGLSAFLDDGTTLGGLGEGTWQQVEGQHKWRISLVIEVSNGDRFRSEDDIDLTTRSLTGKFSEEA